MAAPREVEPVLIDGTWVPPHGGARREIVNPATGAPVGLAAECDAEDVDRAVRAARRTQRGWERTPGGERAVLLHRVARSIREMGRELAARLTLETGKPLIESVDCVEWVAACFEDYAEVYPYRHRELP